MARVSRPLTEEPLPSPSKLIASMMPLRTLMVPLPRVDSSPGRAMMWRADSDENDMEENSLYCALHHRAVPARPSQQGEKRLCPRRATRRTTFYEGPRGNHLCPCC